jgi:hypothetical protein
MHVVGSTEEIQHDVTAAVVDENHMVCIFVVDRQRTFRQWTGRQRNGRGTGIGALPGNHHGRAGACATLTCAVATVTVTVTAAFTFTFPVTATIIVTFTVAITIAITITITVTITAIVTVAVAVAVSVRQLVKWRKSISSRNANKLVVVGAAGLKPTRRQRLRHERLKRGHVEGVPWSRHSYNYTMPAS